jgi:ABC-type branched-subunit amino acid transport system ATPase component/branched-subunit amino acid ABC-type transport system permease component
VTEVLQFGVLALGTGAIYVLLAQGIIVIYRGSGIINFAQGAFAMVGGFLFLELRGSAGWPAVPAILGAAAVTGILGLLVHLGIMRPLRAASALTRTVATLGVLIVLESSAVLVWGGDVHFTSPYLPQDLLSVGDVSIGVDRLWLLGIAAALTLGLWIAARYTLLGLATSAVAESEPSAAALGWSPDFVAGANWALGCALAGLAGALVVPITGVEAGATTLLVIPALAVCLLGSFSSFPLTLLAGLGLAIAESEVARYVSTQGASKSIPFLVIVVVLMVQGRALPLRSHLFERFPALGAGRCDLRVALGALVGAAAVILFVLDANSLDAAIVTLAWTIMMLSVVVLTGYTGQLSLGQLALAGVAALVAGRLLADHGWPFELGCIVGISAAIGVGLLFALPALRTRGANLAVITMGFGLALYLMVFTNIDFTGESGIPVGSISLFGIEIDALRHPQRYAMVVTLALVLCMWLVSNIRRSHVGRELIATRTNERAAASLGINVVAAKFSAFAVSAGIAGVGGIMLAFRNGTLGFAGFDVFSSVQLVAFSVIGGVGFVAGAILGSTFVPGGLVQVLSRDVLTSASDEVTNYIAVIGGIALLAVLIKSPDGLASTIRRPRRWRTDAPDAPSPSKDALAVSRARATPTRVSAARLEVRDLTVRFGAVTALHDVGLALETGKILGLIGPNGAGKTTLIDAVTGYVRPATGAIELDGRALTNTPAHRRARAGITRSFQSLELFEDLTVLENLRCASDRRNVWGYLGSLIRPQDTPLPPAAVAAVHDFALVDALDRKPTELSYGRRRLVAIARAVASGGSFLLLDEPVAGLGGGEVEELATLVRGLATDWNLGILVIEHDVGFVMSVCDEITVLDFGEQIAYGPPDQVRGDSRVLAAYLGTADVTGAAS